MNGIAINLTKDSDYISGNACWKLLWENDLSYDQEGNSITIQALYVERFVPFVLQSDGTLARDEVDQSTGQVTHERYIPANRDAYNRAATAFQNRFPKCSGT